MRRLTSRTVRRNEHRAMKLSSTNAYLRLPFEEASDRIGSLGYDGLELRGRRAPRWPAGLLRVRSGRSARPWSEPPAFSNVTLFMMTASQRPSPADWYPSSLSCARTPAECASIHTRRASALCSELCAPATPEPGPLAPGSTGRGGRPFVPEVRTPLSELGRSLASSCFSDPDPASGSRRPTSTSSAERLNCPFDRPELRLGPRSVSRDIPPLHREARPSDPPITHVEDIAATPGPAPGPPQKTPPQIQRKKNPPPISFPLCTGAIVFACGDRPIPLDRFTTAWTGLSRLYPFWRPPTRPRWGVSSLAPPRSAADGS